MDVQPFSKLEQISYRAQVGGPQKAIYAESCFNFLIFVAKFRCSLKKRVFIFFLATIFLIFVPSFKCSLKKEKKEKSSPRISSYLSISALNVFQQSRETLLRNLYYSQKTGNLWKFIITRKPLFYLL